MTDRIHYAARALIVLLLTSPTLAEVHVSPLWSDHAVIQADQPIKVFGSADAGEAVDVEFAGQRGRAVTDDRGAWVVELPMLTSNAEPRDLTVRGADNTVTIGDLLVGEVWVCSGQSNMWWPVSRSDNPEREIADSANAQLRMFTVKQDTADRPRQEVEGQWQTAGPDTTGNFSAAAYFFGRHLQAELGVPVGLIHSSFSGSPIEAWVSRKGFTDAPSFVPVQKRWDAALETWDEPAARSRYARALAAYERKKAAGTLEMVNNREPRPPVFRDLPTLIHRPSNLYNAMLEPLTRLPIRGVIWYQGEANTRSGRAYRDWQDVLIEDWRQAWGRDDLPFLGVQIPNFAPVQNRPLESWWSELRESQAVALAGPHRGMAVTIDIGDADNIHPSNKQEVGRRLGLLALREVYDKEVAASGPIFENVEIRGDTAVVGFRHAESLSTQDGEAVTGFAVAGSDKRWVFADATIDGQTVRVRSDAVPAPVTVRYAWASNPQANLTNASGLPAGPFRTDDWPGVTDGEILLPALDEVQQMQRGLHLPMVFDSHMVLQHGRPLRVWGWDEPGRPIEVTVAGQQRSATASDDGRWEVMLDPLEPGGPFEMTIISTEGESLGSEIVLDDVLVGEVWLCAGQSNMQWPVSRSDDAPTHTAAANHPLLRLMTVKENVAQEDQTDVIVEPWAVCSPATVGDFSAVGYHFGRELLETLDMPIGLIDTSAGGTRAEAWTRMIALENQPDLAPLLTKWNTYDADWDPDKQLPLYERRRVVWRQVYDRMRADGQRPPRAPQLDSRRPDSRDHPANLYRGMVEPLTPLPIRGVIWYQGESNANRAVQYRTLFPTMIDDWRQQWNQPDMPFYFVQIAGHGQPATGPEEDRRPELREAQALAVELPLTGMATAIDLGDTDVHPLNKQPVGHRLALLARRYVYNHADLVAVGPTYASMSIEGDAIRLRFDHLGGGLMAKEGSPLTGFTLAGNDQQFVTAQATLDGDTVVVRSDQVSQPAAVRYGWAARPVMSLYSKAQLPAPPFRSDDWPLTTDGVHGPWD